jgi:hypothetical protein
VQPDRLGVFLVKAVAAFLAALAVWYVLGRWLAIPVALLARAAVAAFFPAWAGEVEQAGTTLALVTHLEVSGIAGGAPGASAVLSFETDYLKYGYGLPLFLALLVAARTPRIALRAATGWALLLPAQVWGVCFDWLKQAVIDSDAGAFAPLAREAVALGYQFGYLVLPTLVPVLVWAAMNRRALAAFMRVSGSGAGGQAQD